MSAVDVTKVIDRLKRRFPNPGAMDLTGGKRSKKDQAFRTIVGVILSARTRDEQVLKLLPAFFTAFPDPETLAHATLSQVEARLNTIGMYRQKAKNVRLMAQALVRDHQGVVPSTMEELTALSGVGRKTASVVLVACFNIPTIAVDTHVHRVTNRLGWVKTSTPEKTEHALLKRIPRAWYKKVNQVFVKHGRYICIPGKPRCWACPVRDLCAFKGKQLTPPKNADEIRKDIEEREGVLERMREACQ